ncbi:MAG: GIY-YIG nuclease family protein [Peptococcaceae bacterium]|nr:GIY-YIG nuclease family protein [Peptococcaceae bacterium]
MNKYYTYLVRCADGSYYCGYSTDPVTRTETHNSGRGAKYTRARRPVTLVYTETFATKEAAMSREWHIKRMSHAAKAALVAAYQQQRKEQE